MFMSGEGTQNRGERIRRKKIGMKCIMQVMDGKKKRYAKSYKNKNCLMCINIMQGIKEKCLEPC